MRNANSAGSLSRIGLYARNQLSYFGSTFPKGATKRPVDDETSSGITLTGTSEITISGNTFSGLTTKALTLEGQPSRRVLFTGNVLTKVDSDHERLVDSHVADNLAKE